MRASLKNNRRHLTFSPYSYIRRFYRFFGLLITICNFELICWFYANTNFVINLLSVLSSNSKTRLSRGQSFLPRKFILFSFDVKNGKLNNNE